MSDWMGNGEGSTSSPAQDHTVPTSQPSSSKAKQLPPLPTCTEQMPWRFLTGNEASECMKNFYEPYKGLVYPCPYNCGKPPTNRKLDMTDHINRKHIKSSDFQCPYCEHRSKAKRENDRHIRAKHPHVEGASPPKVESNSKVTKKVATVPRLPKLTSPKNLEQSRSPTPSETLSPGQTLSTIQSPPSTTGTPPSSAFTPSNAGTPSSMGTPSSSYSGSPPSSSSSSGSQLSPGFAISSPPPHNSPPPPHNSLPPPHNSLPPITRPILLTLTLEPLEGSRGSLLSFASSEILPDQLNARANFFMQAEDNAFNHFLEVNPAPAGFDGIFNPPVWAPWEMHQDHTQEIRFTLFALEFEHPPLSFIWKPAPLADGEDFVNAVLQAPDEADFQEDSLVPTSSYEVDSFLSDGNTPLHYSLYTDSLSTLELCLKRGDSFKACNWNGITPQDIVEELPPSSSCKKRIMELLKEGKLELQFDERRLQKLRNEETEDFYLQALFSSGPSPEGFRTFFGRIEEGTFRLTRFGAKELLPSLASLLREPLDLPLLRDFCTVLESSRALVKAIDEAGPDFVREHLPLATLLLSQGKVERQLGQDLSQALIELCPSLAVWSSFMTIPESEQQVRSTLAAIKPGRRLLSARNLRERLQSKLSRSLLQTLEDEPSSGSPMSPSASAEAPSSPAVSPSSYSLFRQAMSGVIEKLSRHSAERQQEILEQAERLALKVVQEIDLHLQSLLADKHASQEASEAEKREVASALGQRKEALEHLISIHLQRRKRRDLRLKEKLAALNEALPTMTAENASFVQTFLAHQKLQRETVEKLERLYDLVAATSSFLNPAQALKVIDNQLGELYAASISLVVVGPISVGKSTLLNCMCGQAISPNRVETMTSIPTRYLHDPTAEEPRMLVPFSSQLNLVIAKIRQAIREEGGSQLRSLLRTQNLQRLMDDIDGGLEILPLYRGLQPILTATSSIHDIFRLGVDEIFGDSLLADLPLEWDQGLDSLLTVQLRFPSFGLLDGLVEFCVVDTPGINEGGVKKLRLKRAINDALRTCKTAALVTTSYTYNAPSTAELRDMLTEVKNEYQTPVMTFVNFADQHNDAEVRTLRENVFTHFSSDGSHLVPREQIFFVSTRKKFLASRMLSFLSEHGRLPLVANESVAEDASLASEWATHFAHADREDEKLKYMRSITPQKLADRCHRLSDSSNLDAPLSQMVRDAVDKGIPTSVGHALTKALAAARTVEASLASDPNLPRIQAALAWTDLSLRSLSSLQEELQAELRSKSQELKGTIKGQVDQIKEALREWSQPLSLSPLPPMKTFSGYFARHLTALDNPKVLDLLQGSSDVTFKTEEEASKAASAAAIALKRAIEEYLLSRNENVSEGMRSWSSAKKHEIRDMFEEIGLTYSGCLNLGQEATWRKILSLQQQRQNALQSQLSFDYNADIQRIIRRKKKGMGLLRLAFPKQKCQVEPRKFREFVLEQGDQLLETSEVVLDAQIDVLVDELLKPFVEDSMREVGKLQEMVRQKMVDEEVKRRMESAPREHAYLSLHSFLQELAVTN